MDRYDVAILGAGQMGAGFAVQFRRTGHDVTLIDHRESNLIDARARIERAAGFLADRGVDLDPDGVAAAPTYTTDQSAVAGADVVLETVTEDLEVKREVFDAVADAAPEALLATNTSGIPITDIADGFAFADRVAGCHWLYPPYLLPTVEVVRGRETSDGTIERLTAFVEATDRRPIRVERDVPGFVWNRIQFAMLREAVHLVEEGVASPEDVNAAVRDGLAARTSVIGPLETVDVAGLDLFGAVAADLYPHLADDDEPRGFAERMAAGRGGIEDGAGFLEYDRDPDAIIADRDEDLLALARALGRQG
jgi:3-hydroxyacyl-CoA dehydrogenase